MESLVTKHPRSLPPPCKGVKILVAGAEGWSASSCALRCSEQAGTGSGLGGGGPPAPYLSQGKWRSGCGPREEGPGWGVPRRLLLET